MSFVVALLVVAVLWWATVRLLAWSLRCRDVATDRPGPCLPTIPDNRTMAEPRVASGPVNLARVMSA